jgi:hypothetical protein
MTGLHFQKQETDFSRPGGITVFCFFVLTNIKRNLSMKNKT